MNDKVKFDLDIKQVEGHVKIQVFKDEKIVKETEVHNVYAPLSRNPDSFLSHVFGDYFRCVRSDSSGNYNYFDARNFKYLELINTSATAVDAAKLFIQYARIGWAELYSPYAGSDVYRGTINRTESNIQYVDNSHVKIHIVVDFATNAGNGTFNAIKIFPWSTENNSNYGQLQSLLSNTQYSDSDMPYAGMPEAQGYLSDYIVNDNFVPYAINCYLNGNKIMRDNNQEVLSLDSNGKLCKWNFYGSANMSIIGQIYRKDGVTPLSNYQYNLWVEGDLYYRLFYVAGNSPNQQYRLTSVDKSTMIADTDDSTTWGKVVPQSTFAVNGQPFIQFGMSSNSQSREIYLTGYSTETINGQTVYHNRMFICDETLNIKQRIELGDTIGGHYNIVSAICTKDYIFLACRCSNTDVIARVYKRSDYSFIGHAVRYNTSNGNVNGFNCVHVLAQNQDNLMRVSVSGNPSSGGNNYVSNSLGYPFSFENLALLDSPVTKTALNTMKIQYDVTVEIPSPVYTI